jgi:hypothetical protein
MISCLRNSRLTRNQNIIVVLTEFPVLGQMNPVHTFLIFYDTFQYYLGLPSRLYLPRLPADFFMYISQFSHAVPISSTAIGHPINILNGPNRACNCKTWWRSTVVLGWKKVGAVKVNELLAASWDRRGEWGVFFFHLIMLRNFPAAK